MSPVRRSGSAARPQPEVLRGSLFTLRRRCGTLTCRCADGEGHASPALAYPAGGRTKTLTLTEQEAVEVAAALARYAQANAREVFRQMFQDHLDLRATREQRIEALADADQVAHLRAEPGHTRGLATV